MQHATDTIEILASIRARQDSLRREEALRKDNKLLRVTLGIGLALSVFAGSYLYIVSVF